MAMERIRRALRSRKGQGGGVAMERVFKKDDPRRESVSSPAALPEALRQIGEDQQVRFLGEGACVAAFQAFCDCFCA